ncbi:uncharacterized protein LOC117112469 [Anneissia japonica]|uniref:uncharacterized protein LOC117112469 n=1 Tax=Anneissia japonica TaxID=1529436 RepID=UPI0014255680|nr:uncharacterized protein LOC117112469 [Anneissia japonica]
MVYYSDSRLVLGYISNQTRRFYVYVSNKVERILNTTQSVQWRYIQSDKNPADLPSRGITSSGLASSEWLKGPEFLRNKGTTADIQPTEFPIKEEDPEVRPVVKTYSTKLQPSSGLGAERFHRFSDWFKLLRAIVNLLHITRSFGNKPTQPKSCKGWHICTSSTTPDDLAEASQIVIRTTQSTVFKAELDLLES